jgi:hypothetical protein
MRKAMAVDGGARWRADRGRDEYSKRVTWHASKSCDYTAPYQAQIKYTLCLLRGFHEKESSGISKHKLSRPSLVVS